MESCSNELQNQDDVLSASQGSEGPPLTPGVYYPRNRPKHRHYCKNCSFMGNQRAISKNGELNVDNNLEKRGYRYLAHWFISLVEARWRWTFLNFFLAFTGNWLFFATIYWFVVMLHGDLEPEHLPSSLNDTHWQPCIRNVYGFTSTFLFSIEVHTTIAYGRRAITLQCPHAIFFMCLQCILSSIFQAFMVGILFAKLTRPKARTRTILFSKNALITLRDENLCLIFRVGDMRKSKILNIKASVFLLKFDVENCDQIDLKVEMDGCESIFFLWPISVLHIIDESSPLYHLSAADLLCSKLELLVVFEGTIESTGQPVQAKTSYTENEILWGHRFIPMFNYVDEKGMFYVDFSKFSETVQVDSPLCSAAEYQSFTKSE